VSIRWLTYSIIVIQYFLFDDDQYSIHFTIQSHWLLTGIRWYLTIHWPPGDVVWYSWWSIQLIFSILFWYWLLCYSCSATDIPPFDIRYSIRWYSIHSIPFSFWYSSLIFGIRWPVRDDDSDDHCHSIFISFVIWRHSVIDTIRCYFVIFICSCLLSYSICSGSDCSILILTSDDTIHSWRRWYSSVVISAFGIVIDVFILFISVRLFIHSDIYYSSIFIDDDDILYVSIFMSFHSLLLIFYSFDIPDTLLKWFVSIHLCCYISLILLFWWWYSCWCCRYIHLLLHGVFWWLFLFMIVLVFVDDTFVIVIHYWFVIVIHCCSFYPTFRHFHCRFYLHFIVDVDILIFDVLLLLIHSYISFSIHFRWYCSSIIFGWCSVCSGVVVVFIHSFVIILVVRSFCCCSFHSLLVDLSMVCGLNLHCCSDVVPLVRCWFIPHSLFSCCDCSVRYIGVPYHFFLPCSTLDSPPSVVRRCSLFICCSFDLTIPDFSPIRGDCSVWLFTFYGSGFHIHTYTHTPHFSHTHTHTLHLHLVGSRLCDYRSQFITFGSGSWSTSLQFHSIDLFPFCYSLITYIHSFDYDISTGICSDVTSFILLTFYSIPSWCSHSVMIFIVVVTIWYSIWWSVWWYVIWWLMFIFYSILHCWYSIGILFYSFGDDVILFDIDETVEVPLTIWRRRHIRYSFLADPDTYS